MREKNLSPTVVALTGGIGSGKSTALDFFAQFGAKTISADNISRLLVKPDMPAYLAIKERFGQEVLLADKTLNRKKLRDIIFNHHDEKRWLETLLHPLIQIEISQRVHQTTEPVCVIEIPLLNKFNRYAFIDRVLVITCDLQTRLQYIAKRDDTSIDAAKKINDIQLADKERLKLADDVIDNNGSVQDLYQQCFVLYQSYLNLGTNT